MPAKSKAQARYMRAVIAGDVEGKDKPTKAEAKEFVKGVPTKNLPEKKAK